MDREPEEKVTITELHIVRALQAKNDHELVTFLRKRDMQRRREYIRLANEIDRVWRTYDEENS